MKKIVVLILFIILSNVVYSQYRALWFEGTQYYQLKDSVVTVWGKDTLTSPAMVRALITSIAPTLKGDSSNYSDTSGFALSSGDSIYVLGQNMWIKHLDTIRKIDTANFALNALPDSLFHDDTQQWLSNGDTIPKADSTRDSFTANDTLFIGSNKIYNNPGGPSMFIESQNGLSFINSISTLATSVATIRWRSSSETEINSNILVDINSPGEVTIAANSKVEINSSNNELEFTPSEIELRSNNDTITLINDTASSNTVNLKFKNFFADLGGFFGKVFEGDKSILDTLILGPGVAKDTATGFVFLKDAVEAEGFDEFNFNRSSKGYSEGRLYYDSIPEFLTFYDGFSDFKHPLGHFFALKAYNNSGAQIDKGTFVYMDSVYNDNGYFWPTIRVAGNLSRDSLTRTGVTAMDIPNSALGEVCLVGVVDFINTSNLEQGGDLYIGNAGTKIDSSPPPPSFTYVNGKVLRSDNDSGSVYVYPGEARYNPNPQFSASFNDSSVTIDITVLDQYEQITNSTNGLFTEDVNFGFEFQGDSIRPLQVGLYRVDYTYSFYGDAVQNDDWNIGVFKNGILQYKTLRTSSSTNRGGVPFFAFLELTTSDWITVKVANTSSATRDCVFVDANLGIEFLTE